MATYGTVHGTTGEAGVVGEYISPVVTSYNPDGFVNVNSQQLDTVVVTGINETFNIALDSADSAKLLNIFKIENFTTDKRLDRNDAVEITSGMVSIREGASVDFLAVMKDVIDGATASSSGDHLDQYLANQLWTAFNSIFGAAITGANLSGTLGVTVAGVTGQAGQTVATAGDTMSSSTSEAITTNTAITGFSVDVITDSDLAAGNLYDAHKLVGSKSYIASLYRQIPRIKYAPYFMATDNSSASVPLITSALPLVCKDKLSFVFDVDVNTAGSRSSGAEGATVVEGVPVSGDQSTDYGTSNFSLNLANRRVVFKITVGSNGATGATIVGLVDQPSGATVAADATEGVNFALGATTGATAGSTQ